MIRAHINLLQPEAAFPLQTNARSAVQPSEKEGADLSAMYTWHGPEATTQ